MASMNFPPTPTVGEEYVWEDFVYEWDGEKWTTQVTVVADNHVLKSGDTMAGDLEVPMVYLQSGQVDAPNATTRKDYVDSTFFKKSGDTLGAPLIIDTDASAPLVLEGPAAGGSALYGRIDGVNNWYVGRGAGNNDVTLSSYGHDTGIVLTANGLISTKPVFTNAAQDQSGSALTRKDYVEGTFIKQGGGYTTGTLHCTTPSGNGDAFSAFSGASVGGGFADMVNRRGVFNSDVTQNDVSYAPHESVEYFNNVAGHTGIWSQGVLGQSVPNMSWGIHHIDVAGNNGFLWLFNATTGGFVSPGPITAPNIATLETTVADLQNTIVTLLSRIEALEAQVNPGLVM